MLGLHINDGYGKRDDGLMVGSVHTVQTIELLRQLQSRRLRGHHLLRHLPRGRRRSIRWPSAKPTWPSSRPCSTCIDRLPDAELDAALAAGRCGHRPPSRPGGDRSASMPEAPSHGRRHTQVVVVGSLHYDIMVRAPYLPRPGETLIGERWWWKPGGKGGNAAMAAARHGAAVEMIGCLGEDGFGERLRERLDAAGVGSAPRALGRGRLGHERGHHPGRTATTPRWWSPVPIVTSMPRRSPPARTSIRDSRRAAAAERDRRAGQRGGRGARPCEPGPGSSSMLPRRGRWVR